MSESIRDTRIEDFLKNNQYVYEPKFHLSKIKHSKRTLNNVRGEPGLDDENLEVIRAGLDRGDALPPIIVAKVGAGAHEVIDGHHRIHELRRRKVDEFAAYVVNDLSEDDISMLQGLANLRLNGMDTIKQRVVLAAARVMEGACSAIKAAKLFSVHSSKISAYVRAEEIRISLQSAGHDFSKKPLSDTQLAAMGKLENRTPALAGAAALAADGKMPGRDVSILVRKLASAADDAEVAEVIASERARQKVKIKTAPKRSDAVISDLKRGLTLLARAADSKKLPTSVKALAPSGRQALLEEVNTCKESLQRVEDILKKQTGANHGRRR